MKIGLYMIAYSGVEAATYECSLADILRLAGSNVAVHIIANDADIARSRSKVAASFLRTDEDVCVMVDHDIVWRPGDIECIAKEAHERGAIVAALVSKKNFGEGSASCHNKDIKLEEIGTDRLVPATWVGGAFTAYARAPLEAVCALPDIQTVHGPMAFHQMIVEARGERIRLSEDYAVCQRARDLGFDVFISCKPKCGHYGKVVFMSDLTAKTVCG